ncbi:hypothetical protein ACFL6I_22370 [candidate division KSB1 bacterium]
MTDQTLLDKIFEFQNSQIRDWINKNLDQKKIEELSGCRNMQPETCTRIHVAVMKAIQEGNKAYVSKTGREGLPLFPTSFDDISLATSSLYHLMDHPDFTESFKNTLREKLSAISEISETKDEIMRKCSGYIITQYTTFAYAEGYKAFKDDAKEKGYWGEVIKMAPAGDASQPSTPP